MRLLLDGSCLEVYLATGEVLSTRVYRGKAPRGADAGVDFVAFGGRAKVVTVEAWEMSSIWQREKLQDIPTGSQYLKSADVVGVPTPA